MAYVQTQNIPIRFSSVRPCRVGDRSAVDAKTDAERESNDYSSNGPRLWNSIEVSGEGHCLIYDAGRLGASGTALRSLRATLFSEQVHTIDYLVLSHADTDHFNAVPGLLEDFHVEQVIVSPQFLASPSRSVAEIRRLLIKHEVQVRTVLSGDVISVGTSCVARVLHPQRGSKPSEVSDNENSIVLDVAIESKRDFIDWRYRRYLLAWATTVWLALV